jgi:hypothetical protein
MIKLIVTLNTPLSEQPSAIQEQMRTLFVKYKTSGKIVADFIYVTTAILEIRFNTLASAQEFEQEANILNSSIATFEYL